MADHVREGEQDGLADKVILRAAVQRWNESLGVTNKTARQGLQYWYGARTGL